MKPIMTINEAAEYLRVPVETLYEWRRKTKAHKRQYGPPASKVGKHLRYRLSQVEAWLEQMEAV